jgi:hypothetical protein
MRSGRRTNTGALRLCADLLRHLDPSNRAQSHALATRLANLLQQRSRSSPDEAVDGFARVVSQILDELSPRQRAILERCDVHDENATGVAKSLHISRRHLYRERRKALRWIARRLEIDATPSRPQPITVNSDWCTERIALSRALDNGGHSAAAADALERFAAELDDPDQRGLIEIQLAHLHLRADRLMIARKHTEIARELARHVHPGREWREAEADVVSADIALGAWDVRTAEHLAKRSGAQLKSWESGSNEIRLQNALASARIVEGAVVMGRGDIETARSLAREAYEITARNDRIDLRVRIAAQTNVAVLDIFSGRRLDEAELDLKDCYRQALLLGLTNEALGVAAKLAGTYRLRGRPEAAIDLLCALADIARFGAWQERARVFYELSNAYIEVGNLRAARIHVLDLSEMVVGSAARQGPAQLTAARYHLALHEFTPALLAAELAEMSFTQLGLDRLVGEALLIQIQAQFGLGELVRARRIMTEAIGSIEMTNRGGRLAAAYQIMEQVSGTPK